MNCMTKWNGHADAYETLNLCNATGKNKLRVKKWGSTKLGYANISLGDVITWSLDSLSLSGM